jgi:hypothetical protein
VILSAGANIQDWGTWGRNRDFTKLETWIARNRKVRNGKSAKRVVRVCFCSFPFICLRDIE